MGGLTCRRVLRSGVRVELGGQMNGRTSALVNNRELDGRSYGGLVCSTDERVDS